MAINIDEPRYMVSKGGYVVRINLTLKQAMEFVNSRIGPKLYEIEIHK